MADERDREDRDLMLIVLALLASGWGHDEDFPGPPLRHILDRLMRRADDPLRSDIGMLVERMMHRPPAFIRMRSVAEDVVRGHGVAIEQRLTGMREEVEALQAEVSAIREAAAASQGELHTLLWLASSGVDVSNVPMKRYVPLRIFVKEGRPGQEHLTALRTAAEKFAAEFGLEVADDLGESAGSWWSRGILRFKKMFGSDEARGVLTDARDAINGASQLPQAEANKKHAEATKELLGALATVDNACMQIGSLLVVKRTDNGKTSVVAKTLTPDEVKRLETNQGMLDRPAEVLDWLGSGQVREVSASVAGDGVKALPPADNAPKALTTKTNSNGGTPGETKESEAAKKPAKKAKR